MGSSGRRTIVTVWPTDDGLAEDITDYDEET
jgi:hypothetical protein